jgi:TnsA endonuclease-like protein
MLKKLPPRRWLPEKGALFERPARTIRPSRYAITGRVPTAKAADSQDAESALEQDFMVLLEFDRRVETFAAQPITLRWEDKDGRHRYTPDVGVKYTPAALRGDPSLKTTFVEVKPRDVMRRDWADLKPKFRAAIAWTRDRGMAFRILTETEIRTPFLVNARFLSRYKGARMPKNAGLNGPVQWRVRETLADLGASTPQDLLRAITPVESYQAEYLPWVWFLINQGLIGCDLSERLTMASKIWTLETDDTLGRSVKHGSSR